MKLRALFSPVGRLDLVVKQFTDTVDQLNDVISDCDKEAAKLNEELTQISTEKDKVMGAMDRALVIKEAIETNILGVR